MIRGKPCRTNGSSFDPVGLRVAAVAPRFYLPHHLGHGLERVGIGGLEVTRVVGTARWDVVVIDVVDMLVRSPRAGGIKKAAAWEGLFEEGSR